MGELMKSGILGIVTIVLLFIAAHMTNEVEEPKPGELINIGKEVTKNDKIAENEVEGIKNTANPMIGVAAKRDIHTSL
ncbi:hypothetical protein [uncultured Croceitalea sp.]|uniref:hypothetical protein n=1 Tax=uncultured Croceitalea sp. TaxID=1798908 RepID=UPI00330660A3